MHDPMVVAHEIRRPWPQRSSLPATGTRGDGVRWRIRHYHTCTSFCDEEDGCIGAGHKGFPWWRAGSYASHWRLAGRDYYWPSLITVWHVEPGGRDALSICSHRYQDKHGQWRYTRGWRWHVWHWHLQVVPYQHLRRWALTRCAGCGGRSVKGHRVDVSMSWHPPRTRWWQGEKHLYHSECTPQVRHADG